jgi:hypothetical protein
MEMDCVRAIRFVGLTVVPSSAEPPGARNALVGLNRYSLVWLPAVE